MIKIFFGFVLGIGCLMLVACAGSGMFRDRINDYKTTSECPSLIMPNGMAAEPRSDDYCIPEKDSKSFRLGTR